MIVCCLAMAQMSMAREVIDHINTGNPSLDSLLIANAGDTARMTQLKITAETFSDDSLRICALLSN